MKVYSSAITANRASGKGFWGRNFITFVVRDPSTGDPHSFHFWDGDQDVTVEVINQDTGALEARDYFGGGHIVELPEIVRSGGTGVRNSSLTLSGVSEPVLAMVQGYNTREGIYERHVGEADFETGLLVDTPVCEEDGFIDTINPNDDAVGEDGSPGESTFVVSIASHISTLLRSNPDMRSYEVGLERGDDEIFLYAAETTQWNVPWGEKGHRHKDGDGGDGRDQRPPDPYPLGRR